jgi:VCBS repeat-containing protein
MSAAGAAEGDRLTAQLVGTPAHGSVTLNADGSFRYTPNPGYRGLDSFTYAAKDGTATSGEIERVQVQVGPGRLNLPAVMR